MAKNVFSVMVDKKLSQSGLVMGIWRSNFTSQIKNVCKTFQFVQNKIFSVADIVFVCLECWLLTNLGYFLVEKCVVLNRVSDDKEG